MEIIQFPQSSLERQCVCACVCVGSKCLQACAHSPITKAANGQLNKMEHQRKPGSIVFLIKSKRSLDDN